MDTAKSNFTHVLYQLEDGGSHFPVAHVVLYPRTPVAVSSIPEWFVKRLLEERIAAYCDQGGNLAPEAVRFAVSTPITPVPAEDPFEDSAESDSPDEDSQGTLTDLPDPTKEADTPRKRVSRKSTEDKSPEG